jgi:hypothetical protein
VLFCFVLCSACIVDHDGVTLATDVTDTRVGFSHQAGESRQQAVLTTVLLAAIPGDVGH